MGKNLDVLAEHFSTGAAAQEKAFLSHVFVKSGDFDTIVSPQSRSIRLLVGSKGSGKSALLEYWYKECQDDGIPAIMLTPFDVEVEDIDREPNASLTRDIYKALVYEIGVKVGSDLEGFLSEEQKALVQEAIDAGARAPTMIDRFLKVLSPIGKAATKSVFGAGIDPMEMLPAPVTTTRSNVATINDTLTQSGSGFYVLFDDIDQFGSAGSKNYINTIWYAILAFKNLAERLPNVRTIVTLRSEIWRQISDRRGNERDQIDHVRPMIVELLPSSSDMKQILWKRLGYCKHFVTQDTTRELFSWFFDGRSCTLPTSMEERLWEDYLITSSRERPRDTVQLVQLLVKDARARKQKKINDRNVRETALQYSKERVDDLVSENKDLCIGLETVIRSFADMGFEPDANAVREHLKNVFGWGGISIRGRALTGTDEDMFRLWDILYRIEFLTPRIPDNTQPRGFRHVRYHEDSTLVQGPRWNEMQRYSWDIHPCYRSYLLHIRTQRQKMDLSSSKPPDKRSGRNGRRR